ncbi:MAG TPA: NAD-binding protein [Methanoregula sp.]|nr:NAD-binding protein [Methanoregula sp.]
MAHKRGQIWRAIRNSPGIQIALYFIAFAMLIGFYTYIVLSFYPVLENRPISDANALLFVVQSMSTVGNTELPNFTNPLTMLLSIQIILSGVIMIFIVVPLLVAPFLSALLAPTPPRKTPHTLYGHTVIMGYDELTSAVIDSLAISEHDILIIEQDKAVALEIAAMYRRRAYVIWGDYTDPATWAGSHIEQARNLVISKDERLTANIILGLRGLMRGRIISVVDNLAFGRYLRYAGADYVLSPKDATGHILARHAILNPGGDASGEQPGNDKTGQNGNAGPLRTLRLVTIPVVSGSQAAGKTLGMLKLSERYGIMVISLWRSGRFFPRPTDSELVDSTSSLFLFGKSDAIAQAIREEFNDGGRAEALAVIAGFGDVGKAAYRELADAGISCRVVDSKEHGVEQVIGNAEDDTVLRQAEIDKAQYCIVALNRDDVNIFTALMARNLNPEIRILARANEPATVDKLFRAGADYVALLPTIGAQAIARIVLHETVTILLDLPNGEMVVAKQTGISRSRTIDWYEKRSGVKVIGIERAESSVINPPGSGALTGGDVVVATGNAAQLKKFIHSL